jgi:hypothetical protein
LLNDGSKPLYPRNNSILKNHIHDYGVFGKQSSCVYISLSASTLVSDNVCCNGPRAHVNQNDGFAGAQIIENDLLFNAGEFFSFLIILFF